MKAAADNNDQSENQLELELKLGLELNSVPSDTWQWDPRAQTLH